MKKLAHLPTSFLMIKEAVSPAWIQNKVQGANVHTDRLKQFEGRNAQKAHQLRTSNQAAAEARQPLGDSASRQAANQQWQAKNRMVSNRQTASNAATPRVATTAPELPQAARGPMNPTMQKAWDKHLGVGNNSQTANIRARPAAAAGRNPTMATGAIHAPGAGQMAVAKTHPSLPAMAAHAPGHAPGKGLKLPKGRGLAIAGGLMAAGGLGYAIGHHPAQAPAQQPQR
jgi:hypothetical protein